MHTALIDLLLEYEVSSPAHFLFNIEAALPWSCGRGAADDYPEHESAPFLRRAKRQPVYPPLRGEQMAAHER